jgi:hypothetical protein
MQEITSYHVDHGLGTVELSLTAERLIIRTEGRGLLDRPKVVDVALSELDRYAVVPVIAAQQAGGMTCDSEFIVTYRVAADRKAKRVFVDNDDALRAFLAQLVRRHPAGSLLHLPPAQAHEQLGVASAAKAVYIVIALLVAVPIVIALLTVAFG